MSMDWINTNEETGTQGSENGTLERSHGSSLAEALRDTVSTLVDAELERIRPKLVRRLEMGFPSGLEDVVRTEFVRIAKVDGVFAKRLEDGVICVYALVAEHDDDAYDAIIAVETQLEARFPDAELSFQVIAHQGRELGTVAPVNAKSLFARQRR